MKTYQERKDCSSVEKLIRLPFLKKLSPDESPFLKSDDEIIHGSMLSNILKKNVIEQREILRNQFYKYEYDANFQFYFPQSKFPPVPKGQQNLISYERKKFVELENTYRDKLSPEQIEEIQQKGSFQVKSLRQWVKIPYVWKLNDIIFKGINRTRQDWNDRCKVIYSFANETWLMITEQFPQELIKIVKFPYKLFTLLFGKKSVRVCYSIDYNRDLAKDFWNDVMSEYYSQSKEWFSQIWSFLDSKVCAEMYLSLQLQNTISLKMQEQISKKREQYDKRKKTQNEKIAQINKISDKFDLNWQKIGKKVFVEVSQSIERKYPKNDEKDDSRKEQKEKQILEKFAEEQFNRYTGYLSQELPKINVPIEVIEAILTLLTLINITMRRQKEFENKKSKERQKIQNRVREENPILSSNYSWYQHQVQKEFQTVESQLRTEFYSSFINQKLPKNFSQRQIQAFKLWLEYKRNYEIKIQQKKEIKQDLYQPERVFQSTYPLLPPYEIIKNEVENSFNYATYEIVKSRLTSISTGRWCWKFSLYCMRLKTWTINCFVALVYSFWKGPFGLRCLCGVDQFVYDQDINVMTGQIIDLKRKTVLDRFLDVLQGIQQSRNHFQSLPDTGLFGKTCSRFCNFIECYFFRFFIVGIIVILTLYPILIVLFSLISLLLILTIWIWIPIALLVTYLFNIFVFQFETHYMDLQCVIRVAPFFVLFFKLIFSLCKILFYIVAFFIITPLVAIVVFIYACLCFCFRSFGDSLILCFIRCCGRTPNTDSFFATKISGPDMAVQHFMSLNQEDVYILVQSQIQQIHLQLVSKLTRQKISQPFDNFKKTLSLIIEPLIRKNNQNSYYSSSNSITFDEVDNPIQKNSQLLLNTFNENLTQYKKRYPLRPYDVRFTEQQLNQYLENTQQIVKTYVDKNKLNNWIFDNFDIPDGDYQELNKKIWIKLFQCGQAIFQPLQSIDQRFKLEDQYNDQRYGVDYIKMNESVNLVANAIKGEANIMGKKVARFTPKNPNLFSRKLSITKTSTIFNFMIGNSDQNVSFNMQQPTFILFPHLSIRQLTQLEERQYIKEKEKNEKNWEKW